MKTIFFLIFLTCASFSAAVFSQTQQVEAIELLNSSDFSPYDQTYQTQILNFRKVNAGIFSGARLQTLEDHRYLRSLGIKSVINLQGGDLHSKLGKIIPWSEQGELPEVIENERRTSVLLGMSFVNIPLNSLDPVSRNDDKAIDGILEYMNDVKHQPLYIHCEHGADRTGLLIALYRVKYEGIDAQTARAEWIKNGHNFLHRMFTGDLDTYFFQKIKEFDQ